MEYKYIINGTERTVLLNEKDGKITATLGETSHEVSAVPVGIGGMILTVDGVTYPVRFARDDKGLHVFIKGLTVTASQTGEGTSGAQAEQVELIDGKQILVAPMPGQVVKVNVNVGDLVKKKQCLVIVEAMKMENELNTAIDGVVTGIYVTSGQQVDAMQPLIEITQIEENSETAS